MDKTKLWEIASAWDSQTKRFKAIADDVQRYADMKRLSGFEYCDCNETQFSFKFAGLLFQTTLEYAELRQLDSIRLVTRVKNNWADEAEISTTLSSRELKTIISFSDGFDSSTISREKTVQYLLGAEFESA